MATSAGAVYVDVKANTQPFQQSMNGLGGLASKFGGIITKALSVAALAKFGAECTQVASRLTEVQNVVDRVFPHMNSQIDAWSQNLIESFGLSETKAKEYVGTLGSMARSLGFTEKQAYDMGTSMAELAADIASFYDMSADQAYEKLQSVFTGMVQPLRSLGINMTQASLDAFALANGFGKTVSEMSEAERALLRYQFVLDRTSYAQGDFARTNQSWANQLRILSMRFEELKIAVGNSLIVMLTPVIQVINTIIAGLTAAANAFYRFVSAIASTGLGRFAKAAGKAIGGLTGNSSEAAESTADLAAAQGAAADAAGGQAAAVGKLNRTLAGFDRINKLAADSASGGGGGGGGGGISDTFGALEDAGDAAGGLQEMLDSIKLPENLIRSFEHLRTALGHLADVIRGGLSWAWENVLKPLGEWTINEFAPALVDALASAFDAIASALDALYPIWDALYQDVLRPVLEGLGVLLVDSLKGWRLFFDWLKDVIEKYIDPAIEKAMEAYRLFKKNNGKVTSGKSRWWDPMQMSNGGLSKGKGFSINDTASGGGSGNLIAPLLGVRIGNIEGLRGVASMFSSMKSKTVTLSAKTSGSEFVDKLKSAYDGIKTKGVTLTVNDNASSKTDAAIKKLEGFKGKTVTLDASDKASAKIKAVNDKKLNDHWADLTVRKNDVNDQLDRANKTALKDHWADLHFTPVLEKSTLYMKGKGSNLSVYFAANGGYFERNTPRLAVIGDNTREGEVVSPESKFQTMLDKAAQQGGGNAETVRMLGLILQAVQGIDPNVYLDGRDITRNVVGNINRQVQSTGRSPLIV